MPRMMVILLFLALALGSVPCTAALGTRGIAGPGSSAPEAVDDAGPPADDAPAASPHVPAAPGTSIKNYKVNPFDVLDISVFREPDLHKTVRVSQDGYISFPLIGKVQVAGLDVLSAEQKIAGLLARDYLNNPSVTIFVREYNARKVYVMGEVKTPGAYIITEDRGLTVLESIALAGGFGPAAAPNNTKIIRMENGVKKYFQVKVDDITKKGDRSQDVKLQPNDIILVPARLF